eukprot:ANDGO_01512.mRNA.1 hypothetical protein
MMSNWPSVRASRTARPLPVSDVASEEYATISSKVADCAEAIAKSFVDVNRELDTDPHVLAVRDRIQELTDRKKRLTDALTNISNEMKNLKSGMSAQILLWQQSVEDSLEELCMRVYANARSAAKCSGSDADATVTWKSQHRIEETGFFLRIKLGWKSRSISKTLIAKFVRQKGLDESWIDELWNFQYFIERDSALSHSAPQPPQASGRLLVRTLNPSVAARSGRVFESRPERGWPVHIEFDRYNESQLEKRVRDMLLGFGLKPCLSKDAFSSNMHGMFKSEWDDGCMQSYETGSYRFDFAVASAPHLNTLGIIECDGLQHGRSNCALNDRDLLKEKYCRHHRYPVCRLSCKMSDERLVLELRKFLKESLGLAMNPEDFSAMPLCFETRIAFFENEAACPVVLSAERHTENSIDLAKCLLRRVGKVQRSSALGLNDVCRLLHIDASARHVCLGDIVSFANNESVMLSVVVVNSAGEPLFPAPLRLVLILQFLSSPNRFLLRAEFHTLSSFQKSVRLTIASGSTPEDGDTRPPASKRRRVISSKVIPHCILSAEDQALAVKCLQRMSHLKAPSCYEIEPVFESIRRQLAVLQAEYARLEKEGAAVQQALDECANEHTVLYQAVCSRHRLVEQQQTHAELLLELDLVRDKMRRLFVPLASSDSGAIPVPVPVSGYDTDDADAPVESSRGGLMFHVCAAHASSATNRKPLSQELMLKFFRSKGREPLGNDLWTFEQPRSVELSAVAGGEEAETSICPMSFLYAIPVEDDDADG